MTQAYTLGTWKDFVTYQCTLCPFDCMDEEQAREHYETHFEAHRPSRKTHDP